VSVAAADPHHPCFRNAREQAECPEIRERRDLGEQILDLTLCDGLKRSLAAKFASGGTESDGIQAVTVEGLGYVVRHTPGAPSPLFSPGEARRQAELLDGRSQSTLADRFRSAADEAERISNRGAGSLSGTTGAFAALIMITIVGGAIWYFMLR
jgi:hypothetical protein